MPMACTGKTWETGRIGMQAHMHVPPMDDKAERTRPRPVEGNGPAETICRNGCTRMPTHGPAAQTQAGRLESMRGTDRHLQDMVGRGPTEIRPRHHDSRRQRFLDFFNKKKEAKAFMFR